jgi:CRP-like cAMP-binding protein
MNEAFLDFISKFQSLDQRDIDLLLSICTEANYVRGDYFVREGNVCTKLGFLTSGISRVYHLANDKEYTSYAAQRKHISAHQL